MIKSKSAKAGDWIFVLICKHSFLNILGICIVCRIRTTIINNINSVEVATQEGFSTPGLTESLKAAIVMFSTVPILCIYPWLQKYFIHGVTVGAVKE